MSFFESSEGCAGFDLSYRDILPMYTTQLNSWFLRTLSYLRIQFLLYYYVNCEKNENTILKMLLYEEFVDARSKI